MWVLKFMHEICTPLYSTASSNSFLLYYYPTGGLFSIFEDPREGTPFMILVFDMMLSLQKQQYVLPQKTRNMYVSQ